MTNREWLQTLTNNDLAKFCTFGLAVSPIADPDTVCIVNIPKIAKRAK